MSAFVEVREGDGPLILAFPHVGTHVPAPVFARLNPLGQTLADTDWWVDRLYDGLAPAATTVRMDVHRYVIDVNRNPDGASLYPGQNTTGLCPLVDFEGNEIWRTGEEPSDDEIAERIATWHAPYHAALRAQIARVRDRHGVAILYDCHSIRSTLPFLFDGTLPDLNIGTADGRSCAAAIQSAVVEEAAGATGFSHVANGRFKGGWTTRTHGRPDARCHAVQMELAQSTYLADERVPFPYDTARADRLRPVLARILDRLDRLARDGSLRQGVS
ncbi:MAG: N-formylglutamate deformylase [Azospirillaceae bacterium]